MIMEADSNKFIGGADGPTSIVFYNNSHKLSISQRIQITINNLKRRYWARRIVPGTHSLEEVEELLSTKYGFTEVDVSGVEFMEEYQQMRTTFLLEDMPELAADSSYLSSTSDDVGTIIKNLELKLQQERMLAESIPSEVYDIDFHKYIRRGKSQNDEMHIIIERTHEYIGGGAGGSKRFIREWKKIMKNTYLYYGVSEEDIKTKSQRYKELLLELII